MSKTSFEQEENSKKSNMYRRSMIVLALFSFGGSGAFQKNYPRRRIDGNVKEFIVDVDAGIDDYQALVFLLNAEARGEIRIAAIVLTDGNTGLKDVQVNVCRLLETVRRTDIPVYVGFLKPLLNQNEPDHYYGRDGFSDLGLTRIPIMDYVRLEIAPFATANMILRYPQRYNYLALGPLTNLALALRMYEDVARDIGDIYIMGGNYGGHFQEFNFLTDPESVHMVLSTIGRPATVFPFQACENVNVTMKWRRGINNLIDSNPVWKLNEMAESKMFSKSPDAKLYMSCDPILAAIVTNFDEMVDGFSYNKAQIALCNNDTEGVSRAELVIEGSTPGEANVRIIHGYKDQFYQHAYVCQFTAICKYYQCDERFTK